MRAKLRHSPERLARLRAGLSDPPGADLSFIFATGEHEIAELPAGLAWAERYGAGPRVRRPDVVDTEGGHAYERGVRDSALTDTELRTLNAASVPR